MDERRRYQRQLLVMYLHVFDRGTGKVLGYVGDISRQGLMLISEMPLPDGLQVALGIRMHKLEADLHYLNAHEQIHIACEGQSRWSRPLEDAEGLHATGFMFSALSQKNIAEIDDIIARIGTAGDPAQAQHPFIDALLQLQGDVEAGQREKAANALVKQAGVISVSFEESSPHLMIVQYRRERTSSTKIIADLRRNDIDAHLVKPQH